MNASTLGHAAALHLIDDLRNLDPRLRVLIDARIACDVCSNHRHEWHGEPHGDTCQAWPFADIDACADAIVAADEARHALAAATDLIERVCAAAERFADRADLWPYAPADTAAAFEADILQPLRDATIEADDSAP